MENAALVSTLVTTCALLAVLYQALLLRRQICQEHEWRRRDKALSFSQLYHHNVADARSYIDSKFGYIQARSGSGAPLTPAEVDAIIQDTELRGKVYYFLAYLENIALAVKHNIASFEVIYELLGITYTKYWQLLQPYILRDRQNNNQLWIEMEWLVHDIETERRKRTERPVRLPKLG